MSAQVTDRAALMASQFLNGTTDGMDPQDVAGLLGELCGALTARDRLLTQLRTTLSAAQGGFSGMLDVFPCAESAARLMADCRNGIEGIDAIMEAT